MPRPSGQSRSMPATFKLGSPHEKEVVVDKLLSYFLVHTSERIVTSCEVIFKVGESLLHEVLNSNPLFLGDTRGKAESIDGTTNPDPAGVHRSGGVNVALDLVDVHVAGVGRISADAMVLLDQGVENFGKVLVGVPVSSVDSTML